MGYVAVTGGQDAIDASIELLREYRSGGKLLLPRRSLSGKFQLPPVYLLLNSSTGG